MRFLKTSLLLPFIAMHMSSATAESMLFDFSSGSNVAAWQVVNDDVMGGLSSSRFQVTNGVAVFSGEVSLENNGGFASVRSVPTNQKLIGCDAFLVRALGDGRRYKFTARMDGSFDSVLYQAVFETRKGLWQEHRLRFGDFVPTFRGRTLPGEPPLDPAKVTSVGFLISDKQGGPFRLEVAWIKATASPRKGS